MSYRDLEITHHIGLSIRLTNLCIYHEIKTIGVLEDMSDKQFLSLYRNGPKCLEEARNFIKKLKTNVVPI